VIERHHTQDNDVLDNYKHLSGHRMTVEIALWGVVVFTALALRLTDLGAAPLTNVEAREATLAWRAARGQGFPTANYSPLLLSANGLFFTLFGTGDGLARLLPALCGALLGLTPLLFKRHLGRVGALAAGLYLAVSPTALVSSRQLTGTAVAATGAMVCIGGLARFFETEARGWAILAAVGLALAVSSGATAYALAIPLGVAWVILSQLWPRSEYRGPRYYARCFRPHATRALLTFGLVVLGLSTGLGWNLPGFGAVGDVLVQGLARFRPMTGAVVSPLLLLIVYELLGLVFGIVGLVWGLQRGHHFAALVGLWGGLELVLLALMPGRMPTDLLWAVLPLALLAGLTAEMLARDWSCADGGLRAAYVALVTVLWAYGYLTLARYAALGDQADLALVVIVIVVQALLGLSFGLALGVGMALRALAAATGVALLAATVSAAWGAAYGHSVDPREALLSKPTTLAVRDLVETLQDLSWEETGMPTALEFTVEAPADSILAWYLRGFEMARRFDSVRDLTSDELGPIVVTMDRQDVPTQALGAEYTGQDFALQAEWTPRALGCRFWEAGCSRAFQWLLFRHTLPLPQAPQPGVSATLWRRAPVPDD
jgi:uncharacterized protein (TIGR03663 family)